MIIKLRITLINQSLIVAIITVLMLGTHVNAQQSRAELISRDQALAAYEKFQSDPVGNLQAAPHFIRFIETDGEVHIVLEPLLIRWMYEDYVPEVKAVLYAAYMGGNMA